MTFLVVCLGTGKGTWSHVSKLVSSQEWEKIFFIADSFFSGKFEKVSKPHEFLHIDIKKPIVVLVEEIMKGLQGKIADTEVGLNIVSGTGKEHMAILSALLKLGLGIRLVAFNGKEISEI